MALYKNKFIELDPETCSLDELKSALDKLENLSGYYETKQLAIKTFLNSVYGATACKFFIAYNIAVAESITLQGQDLNHFSENSINDYFSGPFQSQEEYTKVIYVPLIDFVEKYPITDKLCIVTKDNDEWVLTQIPEEFLSEYNAKVPEYSDNAKTVVKKIFVKTYFGPYLGVRYDDVKEVTLDNGRITKQKPLTSKEFKYLTNPDHVSLVIAGDTDSCYVEFGRITNQLKIYDSTTASRFVADLWKYGVGAYLKKCYNKYAKEYNCDENLEELELEKIADTALMTCKKHYAMSKCFEEPNIFYKPGEHISYTGLEIIQGSTPDYAKECLKDFVNFILDWFVNHTEKPSFDILYERIKRYKAGLTTKTPDEICKLLRVNDYEKFILEDKNELKYQVGSPHHVKAAAAANYLLNQSQNKKYRAKYGKIKSGDKVRLYKTADPRFSEFAYIPGKFPIEYAPPMDYDAIFEDIIMSLVNTILNILEYKSLTSQLCYTTPLF